MRKLREARITDVKSFSEAEEVKLKEILGGYTMRKEILSFLEKAKAALRRDQEE